MENSKYLKSFGEHLRQLRETSGLTQKEVAIRLSVDNSLLAKIERNERPPTKKFIKKLHCFSRLMKKNCRMNF